MEAFALQLLLCSVAASAAAVAVPGLPHAAGVPLVHGGARCSSPVLQESEKPKSSLLPRTSSPMQNTAQKKLAWPYIASAFALVGLASGGLIEDQVEELFRPITSKGGWAGALGISPPGVEEARKLKVAPPPASLSFGPSRPRSVSPPPAPSPPQKAKGYTMRTPSPPEMIQAGIFPSSSQLA